jgi:hypothetical protein
MMQWLPRQYTINKRKEEKPAELPKHWVGSREPPVATRFGQTRRWIKIRGVVCCAPKRLPSRLFLRFFAAIPPSHGHPFFSSPFKIRMTATIVFQLRVVTGTQNSLSI